jgi:glycosyltransferase involved in cell wall biosynthesis
MDHATCRLSVIVPVFNEERTLDAVLERLSAAPYRYPDQQVIVVDDGSSDATPARLARWAGRPGLTLLRHAVNRGKGAAIRTGLALATGAVTAIQDADLEYDPADLAAAVELIEGGKADAVYGSRYLRPGNVLPWTKFRLAVHLMNGIVRVLYGTRLTDVNTCYKVVRTDLYPRLALRCERFEYCAEVTAKLCRLGVRIREVPISYQPRTRAEGKKIGWRDALQFAWALAAWRVRPLPTAPATFARPPEPAGPDPGLGAGVLCQEGRGRFTPEPGSPPDGSADGGNRVDPVLTPATVGSAPR